MTLARRIIACLDVRGGRVVKGVGFVGLRDVGDPVELAMRYEAEGADEIVFLNIEAGSESREALLALARRAASELFIPLTIGGGVQSVSDVGEALRAGADKVSINSAAISRPELLGECAERFGAQCVVASIDARRNESGWDVYAGGGRTATGLDAVEWAERCAALGAGEILLTSIDRDGARRGYDLELTSVVSARVATPVVASGGAGSAADVVAVLSETQAQAALLAGVLHDRTVTVADIKNWIAQAGIPVRRSAA
jgi:cyclase